MKMINGKLWSGLSILGAIALVSSAAVFGGLEWALASLGLMVIIGMVAAGVHIAVKISKYTDKSIYSECLEYACTFGTSDTNNVENTSSNTPVKAAPISKKEEQLIMAQIDELFGIKTKEGSQKSAVVKPVGKNDKKLIMAHINEIFEISSEYSEGKRY